MPVRVRLLLCGALCVLGCDGVIGVTGPDDPWEIEIPVCEGDECVIEEPAGPQTPLEAVVDVGLRRLSHEELINTYRSRLRIFRSEIYNAVNDSFEALSSDPQFAVAYSAEELADAPFPYEAYAPSVFLAAYYLVFFGESNDALFTEELSLIHI